MPTSNAFLIINLGCEMLYVIDQRLKAQSISLEKSAQVLRDLTCVLFDQKLIFQLMNPHPCQPILTVQQCRILLTDIACCSLMRLDMISMDKLWDLMVMLCKWQLCLIQDHPNRLLELTLRHMDGVAKLMPEMKKTQLIDSTKRCLIEFWDCSTSPEINDLMARLWNWLKPFNVKISILIRSGFQRNDGTFETTPSHLYAEHFQDYVDNIGENVYAKSGNVVNAKGSRNNSTIVRGDDENRSIDISNELSSLASQLNINHDVVDESDVPEQTATDTSNSDQEDTKTSRNIENEAQVENDTTDAKSGKSVLLVDDVNCSLTSETQLSTAKNVETNASSASEFIYLKKTTSALQGYLEQFRLENKQESVDGNDEKVKSFDATEELLKMLEKDNA